MAREIERKFLVRGDTWRRGAEGTELRQGYLSTDPGRSVRLRLAGDSAWITIKGPTRGPAREEYEYPVPAGDAAEMLEDLCLKPLVVKKRYQVSHGGREWVVDEFGGENSGLVMAEIELAAEDEAFDMPPWAGEEVTEDGRYANASLVENPYRRWKGR